MGEGFEVVTGGDWEPVGGTSASTPMFAALVSLINEARVQQKKAPLGHLNGFIYANPACFTDITVGTNAIDRDGEEVPYGFNTTSGWDRWSLT